MQEPRVLTIEEVHGVWVRHSAITSKALAHGVEEGLMTTLRLRHWRTRAPHAASTQVRRAALRRRGRGAEIFSEAGFHKGSIRDVAERAGLSQAGVLHHYPSKHLLLQAVLDWRDEDALARMGKTPPRGLDMLRALVDLTEQNTTTPRVVELHVTLSAEATAAGPRCTSTSSVATASSWR